MNIKETTFDNYIEQSEDLNFFKQLRWFNKSVALENIITELEASIWKYLEPLTIAFIEARYQDHLKIMTELEKEFQSWEINSL